MTIIACEFQKCNILRDSSINPLKRQKNLKSVALHNKQPHKSIHFPKRFFLFSHFLCHANRVFYVVFRYRRSYFHKNEQKKGEENPFPQINVPVHNFTSSNSNPLVTKLFFFCRFVSPSILVRFRLRCSKKLRNKWKIPNY